MSRQSQTFTVRFRSSDVAGQVPDPPLIAGEIGINHASDELHIGVDDGMAVIPLSRIPEPLQSLFRQNDFKVVTKF